ncbi:MAG: hypothetical protein P1U89_10270 [Verrucomicrobiales bacterium]|nr:hypothetical protein [Verrucomicrobiales bacterium]
MSRNSWLVLLKLCVSITVLARGWLTWRWDSPIRGLVWQEGWWGRLVDWDQFAMTSDPMITTGLKILGIALMISAVVPWVRWLRGLLIPMTVILIVDSFARFIDSGNHLAMAIEHSLQWGCPLMLFIAQKEPGKSHLLMQLATSLTFIGHGLYAVGFHPVPLKFMMMTTKILPLDEAGARQFLMAAGILDFVAAVGILIAPFRRISLYYMIAWGALTACARVVSGQSLDPWLIETLVRTSHWMVPLLLLFTSFPRSSE